MLIALLLTLSAVLPGLETRPPQDPKIIRVFIQTDDGGNAEELAARRESVRHLQAAIAEKKKATIIAVTNEDAADVILEVEQRIVTVPRVVIGLGGGMGSPSSRPGPAAGPVRVVKLEVTIAIARDGDPVEMASKNRANDNESGWKSTAEDVVKQLEKWIAEHRAAILAARR